MNAVSLQSRLAPTVGFSPRLQQAVRLLQLSTLDYARALREAALDNPFLDVEAPELAPPPAPGAERDAAAREDGGAEMDGVR